MAITFQELQRERKIQTEVQEVLNVLKDVVRVEDIENVLKQVEFFRPEAATRVRIQLEQYAFLQTVLIDCQEVRGILVKLCDGYGIAEIAGKPVLLEKHSNSTWVPAM